MIDLSTPEIQFALEAVRRASLLVQQIQASHAAASLTKGDLSPVTVADFASQALVGELLSRVFPNDDLVAEEDAAVLREKDGQPVLDAVTAFVAENLPSASPDHVCAWIDRGMGSPKGRFWTLDPIDGTKGFLRGDQYAVALALIADGLVQIGVLGCPNLEGGYELKADGAGSIVIAVRGHGSWVMPLDESGDLVTLSVSDQHNPMHARLLRSFEAAHTNTGEIDSIATILEITAEPVRMDSQAKYAVLAAGKGELLLRLLSPTRPGYREKIWDQAAGSLIVQEAGGEVTDLDAKSLDFTAGRTLANNRGVLASNGHLHAAALRAIQTVGA